MVMHLMYFKLTEVLFCLCPVLLHFYANSYPLFTINLLLIDYFLCA